MAPDDAIFERRRDLIKLGMISGLNHVDIARQCVEKNLMPAHEEHDDTSDPEDGNAFCRPCYDAVRAFISRMVTQLGEDAGLLPDGARWVYIQRMEKVFRDSYTEFQRKPEVTHRVQERTVNIGEHVDEQVRTVTEDYEDRQPYRVQHLKTAMDAAERSAMAQGVETRKAVSLHVPEEWEVTIDETGVAQLKKTSGGPEDSNNVN